jgi:hypothetical protein
MSADQILFRCSSLGFIMCDPKKGSKEAISETTKTHLVDVFVSNKYNRFTEISAKQLDKGNETEEDSITIISRITGEFFKKNEEHLYNDFIKGTPDLFQGSEITKANVIRDAKSSWDAYTFFRAKNKKLDDKYYWQGMGYMDLTSAKKCSIDYCLNNTPYHLVESELRKQSWSYPESTMPEWAELQVIANHVYDKKTFDDYIAMRGIYPSDTNALAVLKGFVEIPLSERHFNFEFDRKEEEIEGIHKKVIDCREHMDRYLFKTELI